MKKVMFSSVAAALALYYGVVIADDVAKATYEARVERADADYKVAMAKCDQLEGNLEDVCKAEAKKARETAHGNAKAAHEGTTEARAEALEDTADAELTLAKQKCDRMTGNELDACVKKAQLEHTQAVTTIDANKAVAEAADERHQEINDAQYKLAMEKCEGLQGDAQDNCEHNAKSRKANADH